MQGGQPRGPSPGGPPLPARPPMGFPPPGSAPLHPPQFPPAMPMHPRPGMMPPPAYPGPGQPPYQGTPPGGPRPPYPVMPMPAPYPHGIPPPRLPAPGPLPSPLPSPAAPPAAQPSPAAAPLPAPTPARPPPSLAAPPPLATPPAPLKPAGQLAAKPPVLAAPGQEPDKSTTLWVGSIASSVDEKVMQQVLDACGKVKSWKRVLDPTTKNYKGFGFVEYEDIEGLLTATRVLPGLDLDGQALMMKPNSATERYLTDYKERRERERAAKKSEDPSAEEPGQAEEDERENAALEKIMGIISERAEHKRRAEELVSSVQDRVAADKGKEEDGRRGRHSDRERDRGASRQEEERRWREEERRRKEEERRRKEEDWQYQKLMKELGREEDTRLRGLERASKRTRELERERAKAVKDDLQQGEAELHVQPWKRQPYRGSKRWQERRSRRLREETDDENDRQQELEEQLLEKQQENSGMPAATANGTSGTEHEEAAAAASGGGGGTAAKLQKVDPDDPIYLAMVSAAQTAPSAAAAQPAQPAPVPAAAGSPAATTGAASKSGSGAATDSMRSRPAEAAGPEASPAEAAAAAGAKRSRNSGQGGARKAALLAAFLEDEEEDKPRKLIPIQYTEEELRAAQAPTAQALTEEEAVQTMINRLPSSREGVFGHRIAWEHFHAGELNERIAKYVGKKIKELLGEEAEDLVAMVMGKLKEQVPAEAVLEELQPILDDDAEPFVVKLYRTVIYETERAAIHLTFAD